MESVRLVSPEGKEIKVLGEFNDDEARAEMTALESVEERVLRLMDPQRFTLQQVLATLEKSCVACVRILSVGRYGRPRNRRLVDVADWHSAKRNHHAQQWRPSLGRRRVASRTAIGSNASGYRQQNAESFKIPLRPAGYNKKKPGEEADKYDSAISLRRTMRHTSILQLDDRGQV